MSWATESVTLRSELVGFGSDFVTIEAEIDGKKVPLSLAFLGVQLPRKGDLKTPEEKAAFNDCFNLWIQKDGKYVFVLPLDAESKAFVIDAAGRTEALIYEERQFRSQNPVSVGENLLAGGAGIYRHHDLIDEFIQNGSMKSLSFVAVQVKNGLWGVKDSWIHKQSTAK